MGWKRVFALALVLLFLGMTVSGARVAASFVNVTANGTAVVTNTALPAGRGEVKPQVAPIVIAVGVILVDNLLSFALEHYVSQEAAMAYDVLSVILAPDPTDIIRGGKWGIKILAKDGNRITRFAMGIVKEYPGRRVMVWRPSIISSFNAEWLVDEVGKDYLRVVGEKYVKKRGMDFDWTVANLRAIRAYLTNKNAFRLVMDRGWDVIKLRKVLADAGSVEKGGGKLIGAINRDLKNQKDLGPLYEAEVVSHLKRSGWGIKEVEKDVITSIGKTEIDIIAEKNGRTVYIECKRSFDEIDISQIAKQAEYARNHGVRTIKVYYARGPSYPPTYILQKLREISSKYNVEISLVYLGSNFN